MKNSKFAILFALLAVSAYVFILLTDKPHETVIIQTEMYPLNVKRARGVINHYGSTETVYIQDKNNRALNMIFNTEDVSAEMILARLKTLQISDNENKKLRWVVQQNEGETYIRLVHPLNEAVSNRQHGC